MDNTIHSSATTALMSAMQSNVAITTQSAKYSEDIAKAEETAKEFEAVFVSEMIKPMFEGLSTDGMFGGGKGEEVFRSMMIEEYGKIIAKSGSIGLSDQVKEQMIKMQEQIDNGS